jgi:hypothetical protein
MARPLHRGEGEMATLTQRFGPVADTDDTAAGRRRARLRVARIVVASYLVKTLLVGVAWLTVPDFAEKTRQTARAAWARVASLVAE